MPRPSPDPIPPKDALDDVSADLCQGLGINPGTIPAAAAILRRALASRSLYLMRLDDRRAPIQHEVVTRTPAGAIKVTGQDHTSMGIKLIVERALDGLGIIAMLPYRQAGTLGAWLVARAVEGERKRAELPERPDDALPSM